VTPVISCVRSFAFYTHLNLRSIYQTFFVTAVTSDRRAFLQSGRNAALLSRLLFHYRDEKRYQLHSFVIMPDHLHALFTPSSDQSLERCMQCIKGGFSYAVRKEIRTKMEIWQKGFHEHRIRDAEDYIRHQEYIARNPEKRGLREYPYVQTTGSELDRMPRHLSG
jgi:putative transposase